jgi:hypothetical protein
MNSTNLSKMITGGATLPARERERRIVLLPAAFFACCRCRCVSGCRHSPPTGTPFSSPTHPHHAHSLAKGGGSGGHAAAGRSENLPVDVCMSYVCVLRSTLLAPCPQSGSHRIAGSLLTARSAGRGQEAKRVLQKGRQGGCDCRFSEAEGVCLSVFVCVSICLSLWAFLQCLPVSLGLCACL